jgi:hypothetical protein
MGRNDPSPQERGSISLLQLRLALHCQERGVDPGSTDHYVPFAGYLGLAGWPRRVFTDQMILGSLLVATLLVLALAVVALAFSWIDPALLHLDGATPPPNR